MPDPQDAPTVPAPQDATPAPVPPVEGTPAPAPLVQPEPSGQPTPVPSSADELQVDPTEAPQTDAGFDPMAWAAPAGIVLVLALVGGFAARRFMTPPAIGIGGSPALPEPPSAPVPQPADPRPDAPAAPSGMARFTAALSRTAGTFRNLFGRPIDEPLLEELEEALLIADVGMTTTTRLIEKVRSAWKGGETGPEALRTVLRDEMLGILNAVHRPFHTDVAKPWVLLVVGVNGSGKTTTIGKLAARFTGQGQRVLLAAGDTYRAAAAEQLKVWADRAGADFVRHDEGADPGAVAYDALQSALARGHDVVIIDTAGRLQTTKPLMDQLSKIRRVIGKVVPEGPHETLLVIDGTMGQNALSQARLFNEATPLTAVAVTKLDGTAKGGVVLAVADELSLPVKLVGVGEQVDDLRDFDPKAFVSAVLEGA